MMARTPLSQHADRPTSLPGGRFFIGNSSANDRILMRDVSSASDTHVKKRPPGRSRAKEGQKSGKYSDGLVISVCTVLTDNH